MSGTFNLTISMAAECRGQVPAAFRLRVYSVLIETRGNESVFTVVQNTDVRPEPIGSRFVARGQLENGTAVLTVAFSEVRPLQTPPSFIYTVAGRAEVLPSAEKLEGRLPGTVGYTDGAVSVACMSGSHDFLLAR